jgi:hypothetical protein
VPFRRAFPLEVFEAIISHADLQALSRTAQASFACYELLMPVLLDHIKIPNRETLRSAFGEPDTVSTSVVSSACICVLLTVIG